MNTGPTSSPQDAASPRLPELSDARIDAIERALFADIAREPRRSGPRRSGSRHRSVWIGAGVAAAVVVIAAVIAPMVAGWVSPTTSASTAVAPTVLGREPAKDAAGRTAPGAGAAVTAPGPTTAVGRQVVTTASATILVGDVAASAQRVEAATTALGGSVDSMTIGQSGVIPAPGGAGSVMPFVPSPDGGWLTVRVPSDQLTPLIAQLPAIGEVTASTITHQDVTDQAIDLRARIDASRVSVDRLTQLMAQATSTADLIAAEAALAERQATLESYQQQWDSLSGQVAMSTLTVALTPRSTPVNADPAGFGDGVAAGWNGLIATLNGLVIAIGFLIPWIVVLVLVGAMVWAIIALVHRARARRRAGSGEQPNEHPQA